MIKGPLRVFYFFSPACRRHRGVGLACIPHGLPIIIFKEKQNPFSNIQLPSPHSLNSILN